MRLFVGRIIVLFYVISIPLFLGLYVTSMVSAHPKHDALWFDGGATEFGPAAFMVLLAIFVVPICVTFLIYLLSDAESYLKKVFFISLWMSPWPIGAAMVAKTARTDFPMAIVMMNGNFVFWAIACVVGVIYSVYSMHESLSSEEDRRDDIELLSRRHGVRKADVAEFTDRLGSIVGTWKQYEGRQSYPDYVALHLRHFSALRLSVDDYWLFVTTVIGEGNFFKDAALVELDRHANLCPQFGGMGSYLSWLVQLKRSKLRDKSMVHYFGDSWGFQEVTLSQCLLEYRIGEFTSVQEYLEFLQARPSYATETERSKYQAEADRLTHPVLHKMLDLGGFYRARALQIAQRSMRSDAPAVRSEPKPPAAPVVVMPAPPAIAPPTVDPEGMPPLDSFYPPRQPSVVIARAGQVVLRDVSLQDLPSLVMQGQVMMTDRYWYPGMAGWSLVSTYRSTELPRNVPEATIKWGELFTDLLLSWLLYVLGGVFIAGLLGYGNGGASGVPSAIGRYLGFIIMVRPVIFVFRTMFRLVIGKRGMELFR